MFGGSFWVVCGSLGCIIASFVWSVWIYPRWKGVDWSLSRLNQFTIGVFLAAVVLFLPMSRPEGVTGGTFVDASLTLLGSIRSTMRVFMVDMGMDEIYDLLPKDAGVFSQIVPIYGAFLGVLAPALTFTNVLAAFGGITGYMILRCSCFRRLYVMSELSPQSLAMAREILQEEKVGLRPRVAFFDVFDRDEEAVYELRSEARKINALCLKMDISDFRCPKWGMPVEIFLLGENESENLAQAKVLVERFKDSHRQVSIDVYASSVYADQVLDRLDKGKPVLRSGMKKKILDTASDVLYGRKRIGEEDLFGRFMIRRIDLVDLLARRILTMNDMEDLALVHEMAKEDRQISITILGLGRYGRGLLKNAVWFYQMRGYRVQIDVVDRCQSYGDVEERLKLECPEFFTKMDHDTDGEACCHIRFHKGVDCLGQGLEDLVLGEQGPPRPKLVFVALGDDDVNIQTAMNVRRILRRSGKDTPQPLIYTVIHDGQKVADLQAYQPGEDPRERIRFVGTLDQQYSYQALRELHGLEVRAFYHHLDWVRKEQALYEAYRRGAGTGDDAQTRLCRRFREALEQESAQTQIPIRWHIDHIFSSGTNGAEVKAAGVQAEAEKYMWSAYCRDSSIAKALHKQALERLQVAGEHHHSVCDCEACTDRRITEHMRWNAYMRSKGFRYAPQKDMAIKTHYDLVPWKDLPLRERYKD